MAATIEGGKITNHGLPGGQRRHRQQHQRYASGHFTNDGTIAVVGSGTTLCWTRIR